MDIVERRGHTLFVCKRGIEGATPLPWRTWMALNMVEQTYCNRFRIAGDAPVLCIS